MSLMEKRVHETWTCEHCLWEPSQVLESIKVLLLFLHSFLFLLLLLFLRLLLLLFLPRLLFLLLLLLLFLLLTPIKSSYSSSSSALSKSSSAISVSYAERSKQRDELPPRTLLLIEICHGHKVWSAIVYVSSNAWCVIISFTSGPSILKKSG